MYIVKAKYDLTQDGLSSSPCKIDFDEITQGIKIVAVVTELLSTIGLSRFTQGKSDVLSHI